MQLDDLEMHWRRLDEKLDRTLAIERTMLRELIVQPARRRIRNLAVWPAIDVAFSIGVVYIAWAFLADRWGEWTLAVPAAGILAAALVLLVGSVRQLALISEVDWCGPVAEIQAALEKLRLARVRQFKWTILLSPLIGFCIIVVGTSWVGESVSGERFNLIEQFPRRWVLLNYAVGVLFIPLGYLVARVLASRYGGSRWWERLLDNIAGGSLRAARQELAHWSSLEGAGAKD